MRARGERGVGVLFAAAVMLGLGLIWASESSADGARARDAARSMTKAERQRAKREARKLDKDADRLRRQAKNGVELLGLTESQLAALAELGYAEYAETDAPELSGVTVHDRERAWPGLNLYKSFGSGEAHLIDMDGAVVHTWLAPGGSRDRWAHVEMLPGGRLIGVRRNSHVDLVEWDSTPVWRVDVSAHHDAAVDLQGRILVLIERLRDIDVRGETVPVRDDAIVTLSPEGEVLGELWLGDLFGDLVAPSVVQKIQENVAKGMPSGSTHGEGLSVLHTNSVEVLPRDVPGLGSAGQLLISMRSLDLIAVVDPDEPRVVWSWGNRDLEGQHQPTLLPNDNLLIFDNRKSKRWSRVLELDPRAGRIVWEYDGGEPGAVFTNSRGGAEQLPNGNVLVAESNSGRLLEATREGELVWEFLNPDVKRNTRGTIYRVHRLTQDELDGLPLVWP